MVALDFVGDAEGFGAFNVVAGQTLRSVCYWVYLCEVVFVVETPWVCSSLALCEDISCVDCRLCGFDGGDLRGGVFFLKERRLCGIVLWVFCFRRLVEELEVVGFY